MKQNSFILKGLQEDGSGGITAGQLMMQSGQLQEVANANHVGERPGPGIRGTGSANNLYRISTEPEPVSDRLIVASDEPAAIEVLALPPGLTEIVAAWPHLPEAIKGGVLAMFKATVSGL